MSLDLNEAARRAGGGAWVKLRNKDDGTIEGVLVDIEERDRTNPKGEIVRKKGTDKARKEWVLTIETDLRDADIADDDGVRKVAANESMQRAIGKAIKESGSKEYGGRIKIGVKEDPADDYAQAEYQAKYSPPAPTIDIDESDF